MKKLLTALPLIVILVSCQKEIGFDTPSGSGGGGATGNLLVKTVAVTGTETLTTLYTYDAQKRLETTTMDGTSAGIVMHIYTKLLYDAAGRVYRVIQYAEQDGVASDTATNKIHYPNATTVEYDYSVNSISMFGMSAIDSSVYQFASGQLINFTSYLSSPMMGPDPIMSSKYEFNYDGSGRVSLLKLYAMVGMPGSPLSNIANQSYTYNTTVNTTWPATSSAQAYLIHGMPNTKNDAVATLKFDSMTAGVDSFSATTTYVLGTGNKPTAATYTSTDGQVTKYSFFYQ